MLGIPNHHNWNIDEKLPAECLRVICRKCFDDLVRCGFDCRVLSNESDVEIVVYLNPLIRILSLAVIWNGLRRVGKIKLLYR